MKNIIPIFLLAVILIACNSSKEKTAGVVKSTTTNSKPKLLPANKPDDDTTRILLSQTSQHAFSDQSKQDTFKLVLRGRSIIDGNVTFDIIAFNHRKIYTEKFRTDDLLGDLIDFPLTANQKTDTIKARFYDFFNKNAFTMPALDTKELIDTDYVDLKTQKDIRSDKTAIGFSYAIGYEGFSELAYSKRKKEVVVCQASD